ncbi:MAG TPA: CRISPR-associated endonuclease Cas1, partial [Phycisphaerae bacterium]|nr:CRISPR-associated endonuclease Cas1 [Phycisphaerae bacterium]
MKTHDNTLYVTTQKAYLARKGTNIDVRVEGQSRLQLPVHTVGSIVCFGNVLCSPFLLGLCAQHRVAVTFLTENGRFMGRVEGPQSGNVLLR